ncbi:protease inhibitor I42 family protein [Haliscomenobacter hydrossis]|uniref:protease inhibitor I42 family protein n=1 Tax=Haliscomenobacter hydrossis TaxID=2350 RepID=UPI00069387FD|nr:protease inhibitor I42 family protein [Haliscomenobacter hydrossis]
MKIWLISLLILAQCQTDPDMIPEQHTIRAKAGEKFEIKLPGSIATGYSWTLVSPADSQYVHLESQVYEESDKKVDGKSGMDVFVFKALKQGKTTLDFVYRRPFDKQIPTDAKRENYTVRID